VLAVYKQPLLYKGSKAGLYLHLTPKEVLDQEGRAEPKRAFLGEEPKTDPDGQTPNPALNTKLRLIYRPSTGLCIHALDQLWHDSH